MDYRTPANQPSKIDETFKRVEDAMRKELAEAYMVLSVATSIIGRSYDLTQKQKLYLENILLNERAKIAEQMTNVG